jgi:hypothetical protein
MSEETPAQSVENDLLGGEGQDNTPAIETTAEAVAEVLSEVEPVVETMSATGLEAEEEKLVDELTDPELESMVKELAGEVHRAECAHKLAKEDYASACRAMQSRGGKATLAELNQHAKRNTRVEDDRRRKAAQAVRTLNLAMKRRQRKDGTSGTPSVRR